ncbi:MAG: CRTAC1 family protein, partial [Bacteroidetes bacterium]|nr:CRTAC1 family protein [Bacteroidota bacterium]
KPLFLLLDEKNTGIHFQNTITPNQDYNLLDFEYLYNGGGVGVGDFDKNGLPDLVFTGNMVISQIYLNKGNLQFEDITKQSGFDTQGKWCTGVSIIDINNDGYDDIYLCVGGAGKKSEFPNLLFINQGDLTFVESAAAYGLDDPNESNQAMFFDYDMDGDLDMYLLNGGGFEKSAVTIRPILKNGTGRNTDKLYRNDFDSASGHPVFVDVSLEAGIAIEGFGLGVGMIDANHDGWPDIYVSNDYLSRDLLYINQQNGTFREAAEQYLNHMSHFSMGNDVGDMNNDGQLDLITLDMLPESHYRRKMMFGPSQRDRFYQAQRYGYGQQYMRNMLHVANNDEGFREIGQLAGIDRTDWSWAPLIADFDHDGFQDVYITNGYGKDITDLDFVKFRKDAIKPFVDPDEIQKILLNSLDDLPAIVLPNYAYKNKGDYTFENTVESWGFSQPSISNGAVYADLDLDGDLEIITNNIDRPAFIYKNTTRERDSSHFLQVKLMGGKMNRSGIGSVVSVYRGTEKRVRYQQPVKGFQSSVTDILHFGLGENTMIDSLSVIWPDGKRNVMFEIPANQLITINYNQANLFKPAEKGPYTSLLTKSTILTHQHKETILTDDFKNQPLLIHGLSQQGPGMAVGDVNHDNLDDIFIGGA